MAWRTVAHARRWTTLPGNVTVLAKLLMRFFRGLRFPWLFAATAVLFGIDLIVPDVVPLADELLLGLTTLLLASWRAKKSDHRRVD